MRKKLGHNKKCNAQGNAIKVNAQNFTNYPLRKKIQQRPTINFMSAITQTETERVKMMILSGSIQDQKIQHFEGNFRNAQCKMNDHAPTHKHLNDAHAHIHTVALCSYTCSSKLNLASIFTICFKFICHTNYHKCWHTNGIATKRN